MHHDKESIQQIIRDTVSLLCRNGLSYAVGIHMQGLIGITIDDSEVFLVHFDESFGTKQSRHDGMMPPHDGATEPPKSSPRKRLKLSETTATVTSFSAPAKQSDRDADVDSDVIFVADDANDKDVKLGLELFCSSDEVDNSLVFKPKDTFDTIDLNVDINNTENESCYVQCTSGGISDVQNNYMTDLDQASDWQIESVPYEATTAQITSIKREQPPIRPRIKQVSYTCSLLEN